MENLRKYGEKPFNIAVIHGGPGAAGEMAPVARELSKDFGILEPLQTEDSIEGQIQELKKVLEQNASLPVVLIGWSWGAWLSFIFAARYPNIVKKLILVNSGPFEEKYAEAIEDIRLSRLNESEKKQLKTIANLFNDPAVEDKNSLFADFGKLFGKTDSYDPIEAKPEAINVNYDIYQKVWDEAAKLRQEGDLLNYSNQIRCPVVALHGDFDPHPAEGVKKPLSQALNDFKFILLKKCGHSPWKEKEAKDKFYSILKEELTN